MDQCLQLDFDSEAVEQLNNEGQQSLAWSVSINQHTDQSEEKLARTESLNQSHE
jgi:hypothetical protein